MSTTITESQGVKTRTQRAKSGTDDVVANAEQSRQNLAVLTKMMRENKE